MRVRGVMLLAVLGLCVAGCAGDVGSEVSDRLTLADTQWDLAQFAPGGTTTLAEVPSVVMATATFTADRISGDAGCNTFTGGYSTEGTSITVGPVATTLMACSPAVAEVEDAYLALLGAASTYSVSGDTLTMSDEHDDLILSFTAASPTELVGTHWQATGINNGRGGVSSTASGTQVTAVFDDSETLTGSAGCNRYTGSYLATAATLEMGEIATSRRTCIPEISEQETQYLAALGKTTSYSIVRNTLDLRDESGALQVSFVAEVSEE